MVECSDKDVRNQDYNSNLFPTLHQIDCENAGLDLRSPLRFAAVGEHRLQALFKAKSLNL